MQWSSHVLPFMSKQNKNLFKHSSYWLERVIKILNALYLLKVSSRASWISHRAANMSEIMVFTCSVPSCVISVHNWRRICFCVSLLHAVHQKYSRHRLWKKCHRQQCLRLFTWLLCQTDSIWCDTGRSIRETNLNIEQRKGSGYCFLLLGN